MADGHGTSQSSQQPPPAGYQYSTFRAFNNQRGNFRTLLTFAYFIFGLKVQVISWLLNHNPNLRPSSAELLQSPNLPPPQLEDAELQEMVRHTLSNTQSKAYKHLVAACFQQNMTPSEDIVFDMDTMASTILHQSTWLMQTLQEVFVGHCKRRGAVFFKVRQLKLIYKIYNLKKKN